MQLHSVFSRSGVDRCVCLFYNNVNVLLYGSDNLAARPRQPRQRAIKDPAIDQYPPKDKAS